MCLNLKITLKVLIVLSALNIKASRFSKPT